MFPASNNVWIVDRKSGNKDVSKSEKFVTFVFAYSKIGQLILSSYHTNSCWNWFCGHFGIHIKIWTPYAKLRFLIRRHHFYISSIHGTSLPWDHSYSLHNLIYPWMIIFRKNKKKTSYIRMSYINEEIKKIKKYNLQMHVLYLFLNF